MKLPRNLSGDDLASKLRRFGYKQTRQTGSHLRLTQTTAQGTHHITIPQHKDLRIGTLNAILKSAKQNYWIRFSNRKDAS